MRLLPASKDILLSYAKNLLLILCSILFAVMIVEAIMHVAFPYLPQSFYSFQCREFKTLGQTSKQGVIPKAPYIAIIGDSYGAGVGDWFADEHYNLNSRFQAAHVLQEMTGQDVVSLSEAGAGNFDGAMQAVHTWNVLHMYGFDYPDPEMIFVYFYEGNDVSDNLRLYNKYFVPQFSDAQAFSGKNRDVFVADMTQRYTEGSLQTLGNHFFVGNYISLYFKSLYYKVRRKKPDTAAGSNIEALVGGNKIFLPDVILKETPLGCTEGQILLASEIFAETLQLIRKQWSQARLYVVYIPCPLTSYTLVDKKLEQRMQSVHEQIVTVIQNCAIQQNIPFFDATSIMKKYGKEQFIHGPKDWTHFNRAGYTALAEKLSSIVSQISEVIQ